MTVELYGIRHHGPGSARAVRRALTDFAPDIVLVEMPADADDVVQLATDTALRPPVALLAYDVAAPRHASSWPFAVFSPEWQAIRYAVARGVPVRGCDLPAAHRIAIDRLAADDSTSDSDASGEEQSDVDTEALEGVHIDPIGTLAAAAGYDDPERWWDDVVEHRLDGVPPFAALAEAMAAVRAAAPERPEAGALDERRREAYMRGVLRRAEKAGHERIAVVCGAWHVPALADRPPVSHDTALLRGLPKAKVALTWVPWTHGRLASWQGYGAGVASPGWYHHLFAAPDRVIERWFVATANLLRDEGLPTSSAHVIEAVRLADTLAALRGRPLAGLDEVTEAARAVLCDGDDARLALIQRRLVVGEQLGTVPADTPTVPLQRDLATQQKRLRLPAQPLARDLDLDLRGATDADRSRLLHRLRLLDVDWGVPAPQRRGKGTFWESWKLAWRPELAIAVIDAAAYGTTVASAASARVAALAAGAGTLADLTALVGRALLADLADALPPLMRSLDNRAAGDADVTHLMAALPALVRTLRYGDVRGTDTGALATVTAGLVVRVCVALPPAMSGLDGTAAAQLRDHVDAVHSALDLLADARLRHRWLDTLAAIVDRPDLPGLLAGRLTRLLYDAGRLADDDVARRMQLVLTVGTPAATAASWVEGFLAGGGVLLVHDDALLALVDRWLTGIPAHTFGEVLPLLRRTFAGFTAPERRAVSERIRSGGGARSAGAETIDDARAAMVLPTMALLLGLDNGADDQREELSTA